VKRIHLLLLTAGQTLAGAMALAQTCPTSLPSAGVVKGKISRNFYRAPYANGTVITMGSSGDYFGHNGSMDTFSIPSGGVLVSPEDGVICEAADGHNDCGCLPDGVPNPFSAGCGNLLSIVHANGEMSSYLHMQQFSIRNAFGVTDPSELIGVYVQQGQMVGLEGDVGRTCGNTSPPRWSAPGNPQGCLTEAEASTLTPCGSHVHWNTRRLSTGELLQPMTCNILIYDTNANYTVAPCEENHFCLVGQHYSDVTWSGFGNAWMYQSGEWIHADDFVVENQASIVFHASTRIKLLPGFRAGTGDAYFRAEIGPCGQTAPNP